MEGDHHGGRRAGAFAARGRSMQQRWIAVKGRAREGRMRMSGGSGVDQGLDVERPDPVKTLHCIHWPGKRQICRPTWQSECALVTCSSRRAFPIDKGP